MPALIGPYATVNDHPTKEEAGDEIPGYSRYSVGRTRLALSLNTFGTEAVMTEAVGADCAPARVASASDGKSDRHVPGEPGIWILIFGDLLLFTVLFAVYLHQRGADPGLFSLSQERLNRALGAANTVVLLTSSALVVFATHALRVERWRPYATRLMQAALAVGAIFVVVKAIEYREKISVGITPNTDDFFMYYFVLTGVHLLHVVIGLAVLTALSVLVRKPEITPTRMAFVEGGACFWHLVDLLWLVIFPLLFLVR